MTSSPKRTVAHQVRRAVDVATQAPDGLDGVRQLQFQLFGATALAMSIDCTCEPCVILRRVASKMAELSPLRSPEGAPGNDLQS